MSHPSGYLAAHPVPSGITGALSLVGYQLLADIGGVGAGRLGSQAFLVVAPDPAPDLTGTGGLAGAGGPAGAGADAPASGTGYADVGTQISLHTARLRDETEAAAYVTLAAQLGYLRLSGYRVALERAGLRSKLALVNPATGAVAATIPEKAGGRLFGGGATAGALIAGARALPPAGPPPDLARPEALREVLMALALTDESLGGAEAAEAADRALALIQGDSTLDPARALAAAKTGLGE
jgi:hypothetical protein